MDPGAVTKADWGYQMETHPSSIMIVDDDEELAELLKVWLIAGYPEAPAIEIAHSLQSATETLLELHRLDIVLLDRRLPDGTGKEVLDEIEASFDAIVVMLTAVEPDTELLSLPVADYLVKPIERDTLITRLSLLEKLDRAGALREYADARKAVLLEQHLDSPADEPLFRRFASRWAYDRLEIASTGADTYVYELYLPNEQRQSVEIMIVGSLAEPITELFERGDVRRIGDIVPSGENHAWVDRDEATGADESGPGVAIYEFDTDVPERLVGTSVPSDTDELETILRAAYQ